MADVIGVLGETTATATGTTTAYTVPAGKAARVKLFYQIQAGAGGAGTLQIKVNGVIVLNKGATTASHYIYSTAGGAMMVTGAALPTGATAALTCAPADSQYFLSAGDVVQIVIGGEANTSTFFQVVGSEVDVS